MLGKIKGLYSKIKNDKKVKELIKPWVILFVLLVLLIKLPLVFNAFNITIPLFKCEIYIPVVNITSEDLTYTLIKGTLVLALFIFSIIAIIEPCKKNEEYSNAYITIAIFLFIVSAIIFWEFIKDVLLLLLFGCVIPLVVCFVFWYFFIFILGKDVVEKISITGCIKAFILNICIISIVTFIVEMIFLMKKICVAIGMGMLIIWLILLFKKHKNITMIYNLIIIIGFIAMLFDLVIIAILLDKGNVIGNQLVLMIKDKVKICQLVLYTIYILHGISSNIIICNYNLGYEDYDKKYYVKKANILFNFFGIIIVVASLSCLRFEILYIIDSTKELLRIRNELHNFKLALIDTMQVVALVIAYISMRNEKNLIEYYEKSIKYLYEKIRHVTKRYNIKKYANRYKRN